jgi:hypothetical protein
VTVIDVPVHGVVNGYLLGCRCDDCRAAERARKQKCIAPCEECGGRTSTSDRRVRVRGGSRKKERQLCNACSSRLRGERQRGTGELTERLLALLDGRRRTIEVAAELGITQNHAHVRTHQLVKFGLVERVSRGVYRRT